jgi:hypothetical protein
MIIKQQQRQSQQQQCSVIADGGYHPAALPAAYC